MANASAHCPLHRGQLLLCALLGLVKVGLVDVVEGEVAHLVAAVVLAAKGNPSIFLRLVFDLDVVYLLIEAMLRGVGILGIHVDVEIESLRLRGLLNVRQPFVLFA